MSPSRSKTICRPFGLTSTFIHVPSDESNDSFVVGPRSAVTSHLSAGFCWAETVASSSARPTGINARMEGGVLLFRFIVQAPPQVPRGNRSVRTPRFAKLEQAIWRWFLPETIGLL